MPISHAQQRCKERYGITLTLDDINAIEHVIGSSGSMFVRLDGVHERWLGEVWDVCYRSQVYRVVFMRQGRKVMTFLPPHRKPLQPSGKMTIAERMGISGQEMSIRDRIRMAWGVLRYRAPLKGKT